jgi:hypothetical protein
VASVEIDVRHLQPDAVTVDALARLQLAAKRSESQLLLRGASTELRELVDFMGLGDVLVVEAQR